MIKQKKMKALYFIFFSILLVSCSEERPYPWLSDLDAEVEFIESGKNLMGLEFGLHPLEAETKKETQVLIAVHGSNSNGYEWVYPLKTIDNQETLTLFFRWDDASCPNSAFRILGKEIDSLLKKNISIKKITLMGHSYGALLVSMFSESWISDTQLDIHSIAGPLIGSEKLNKLCNYGEPIFINPNVNFYEWRTQKKLDGAFKDLKVDPQIINLKNSNIVRLPEVYRGKKLGHNWSLSWVADEINSL
jgi:hypothetical protein